MYVAPLRLLYPSMYSLIRKRVWRSGRASESKFEILGSRPGDVTFETIQFCRTSSTFVKVCRKSSIFIVKSSAGMSETFFDTCVNWSWVTRCGCRTTSSTLFLQCSRTKWIHFLSVGDGREGEDLWKGWALKITWNSQHTVQNTEYTCSKTCEHKITNVLIFFCYTALGLNDLMGANSLPRPLKGVGFFGPKSHSLRSLPFQGPKKSLSGPTPSNVIRNGFSPNKIITSCAIPTIGTLIVKKSIARYILNMGYLIIPLLDRSNLAGRSL